MLGLSDFAAVDRREADLRQRFGDVLTLEEAALVLRYPTADAARKARRRGKFPIPVIHLAGRRGWHVSARALATYLANLHNLTGETAP